MGFVPELRPFVRSLNLAIAEVTTLPWVVGTVVVVVVVVVVGVVVGVVGGTRGVYTTQQYNNLKLRY